MVSFQRKEIYFVWVLIYCHVRPLCFTNKGQNMEVFYFCFQISLNPLSLLSRWQLVIIYPLFNSKCLFRVWFWNDLKFDIILFTSLFFFQLFQKNAKPDLIVLKDWRRFTKINVDESHKNLFRQCILTYFGVIFFLDGSSLVISFRSCCLTQILRCYSSNYTSRCFVSSCYKLFKFVI